MSSTQEIAPPLQLSPDVSVGVWADGDGFGDQVVEALAGSGATVSLETDGRHDVLVYCHRRSDTEVCSKLREQVAKFPSAVVILVVERAGTSDVRRALEAGAHGVVTQTAMPTALIPSIEAAFAGQVAIPARAREAGHPLVLTPREKQILGLVVMGLTNAEIAGKLFLAESTIKSHLSSAFSKLGVSSRSEASSVILDPQRGAGLGILTIPSS
jgi:DNA-binding NarL/FixJ family response regulator